MTETKRKIIGKLFIDVFQKYAGEIEAQNTSPKAPSIRMSLKGSFSGGPSVTISPTTTWGIAKKMGLKLVEPLRELFKDEVRALGRELGLPDTSLATTPSLARVSPLAARVRSPRQAGHPAQADAVISIRSGSTGSTTTSGKPSSQFCRYRGRMGDGRTYDLPAPCGRPSVDGMRRIISPSATRFLGGDGDTHHQ